MTLTCTKLDSSVKRHSSVLLVGSAASASRSRDAVRSASTAVVIPAAPAREREKRFS